MKMDINESHGPALPVSGPRKTDPPPRAERLAMIRPSAADRGVCLLSVPGLRCGGCVAAVERALAELPHVVSARANLTLKQVRVVLARADDDPLPVLERLDALGHEAHPIEADREADTKGEGPGLLRAMAVAGFGAMNVMLLSVAVWSGADGAMRETFHLISGLIALPVVAYAGQPFFWSALSALKARRLNMDVPIALAILLAVALSLFETARGGEEVFFDAAVTLLFFLLTGRYLDQLMRDRARSAVMGLARLAPKGALRLRADGGREWLPKEAIAPGMRLVVAAGERLPVDARIRRGTTDLDRSIVTGEAMPLSAGPGMDLEAGTLNLTGEIEVEVLRAADASFLAEMMRMLGAAEGGRGGYVRIADRAARLYAPVVHLLALLTFMGWLWVTRDWQASAFVAISVLIITCPCALGLAVPVAHVVAAGRLMREGVLMKDGAALERLAEIDRALFDKTGTLTTGTPRIAGGPEDADDRAVARALALRSRHPAARAIAGQLDAFELTAEAVAEHPGLGVEGVVRGRRARLGRASWVAKIAAGPRPETGPAFAIEGQKARMFDLHETLRPAAREAVAELKAAGLPVALLSGDAGERAARIAALAGIDEVHHGATPAQKVAHLDALRNAGHRALMVGDGLNDAAALAAAHVSMAPASASEAGRTAADFVILRDGLDAVPATYGLARATARIVRQNFALAIAYNCIAIPLAMAGLVTPLLAALAMSGSSILVIGNALRLNGRLAPPKARPEPQALMMPA
ncbi:heavy metal translocating P-type ATPase [Limimaricola cinnabarinus]|uniref:heavy metal translocating P-type ATPase n=1 Tax=Limimaricola cinnabarinus TaxID=1125964 RepID=UPI002FE2FDBC